MSLAVRKRHIPPEPSTSASGDWAKSSVSRNRVAGRVADSRRLLAIVMAPFTAILGLAGRTIGAGDAVWAARRQLGGRLGGRGAPAAISAQTTFGQSTPIEFGSGRPSELTWSTGMRASPNGLETPPIDAAGDFMPFWWQSPPIPTGPSWRPPRSMSLTVAL